MLAFLTPAVHLNVRTTHNRTCRRRPMMQIPSNKSDMSPSWEEPNYETLGKGIPSRGLQTIEFIIRQDGTVEEKITGVRGKHCEKLTEKIEKALGRVVHTEKTEEYFQEVTNQVVEHAVNTESVSWPGADNLPTW